MNKKRRQRYFTSNVSVNDQAKFYLSIGEMKAILNALKNSVQQNAGRVDKLTERIIRVERDIKWVMVILIAMFTTLIVKLLFP